MNTTFKLLVGGVAASLLAFGALAQGGPQQGMGGMQGMSGMGGMSGMQGNEAPRTPCGKARDPQRCEALQKAKETCKDKTAAEKRKCIFEAMPPADCTKARSPERCEAMQKAKEACKDKTGPEHRQCLRDNMPKPRGKG